MINYDTIVVINREVFDKIEFYRPFLAKSEFGTFFEDVCFTPDDSADALPSAVFNGVQDCLFLYGLIDKEAYEKYYNEIEKKRDDNPNMNYYMLFCQEKYCACGSYASAGGSVKKTFSIGILEEDDLESGKDETALREDIRALKLLALAMAVYTCNKGPSQLTFDNYYVTANVELDLENIYFAIMHKLSKYVDRINSKKGKIASNEEEIRALQKRKPKLCKAQFPNKELKDYSEELEDFSKYDDMEKLRCDMEFVYNKSSQAIKEDISKKIDVARKAEAIAEKSSLITCSRDEITNQITIKEDVQDFKGYMTISNADEKDIPVPDDLLERVDKKAGFDAYKIKNLLPLAREFDEKGKVGGGKVFLWAVIMSLAFVVCVCAIYLTRYLKFGLNGVTYLDFLYIVGIPAIVMIATGLIGIIVHIFIKLARKGIFKDVYNMLVAYLKNASDWCKEVGEYINKYLTVYYNFHVKHARIAELEEDNLFLDKEIKKITQQASPLNDIAETVCRLGGDEFEKPDISFATDRSEYPSAAEAFEARICKNCKTEVSRTNNSVATESPWLKKVVYETGNINGGVQ